MGIILARAWFIQVVANSVAAPGGLLPGSETGDPVESGSDTPLPALDFYFTRLGFVPNHVLALRELPRLLEAAGCAVELPAERLCCGRPYYDYGMLDEAKRALERVMRVLPADRPVVVLEPGCLSVFRDELRQLFPDDERAKRLASQVVGLSELLNRKDFKVNGSGRVLMHGHCHQKALWGTGSDIDLLKRSGFEVIAPDTGCCGMSGSFGYRAPFYEASRTIAGLELLPALERSPAARVVADGFSCREQIEGLSGRPTLHLAELLSASLR